MRATITTANGGKVRTQSTRRYVLVRERVSRFDGTLLGEPSIEMRSDKPERLWGQVRRLRNKMTPSVAHVAFSVWDTVTREEVTR